MEVLKNPVSILTPRESMTALTLEGQNEFPTIKLDSDQNRFEISGRSTASGIKSYFADAIAWMRDYLHHPNLNTVFDIRLDTLNIDTSQCLLDVLRTLNEIYRKGFNVKVRWFYTNGADEMLEIGEDLGYMVQCPVELIPVTAIGHRSAI